MTVSQQQPERLRFDSFELDPSTAELYRNGRRVKLQDQPARLLVLLANRPGELVSRLEIQNTLWEDGQFVEFEHAINVAIKKIREVLDDDPANPRIIETLPKKGYRFIAAVSGGTPVATPPSMTPPPPLAAAVELQAPAPATEDAMVLQFLLPSRLARAFFLGVQILYLAIYCTTLILMMDVSRVLGAAGLGWLTVPLLVGASCGIPIRCYLLFTVGLGHPAAGLKYGRMLPYLMVWDWLWAPSPFLAIDTFGPGLAVIFAAILVYPPISQLILMRSLHPADLPAPPRVRT